MLWAGSRAPRAVQAAALENIFYYFKQTKKPKKLALSRGKAPAVELFFCLASGGCKLEQTRPWLGLVDLSRIPSGTFFREVHPGSEMASQNDQNKAK